MEFHVMTQSGIRLAPFVLICAAFAAAPAAARPGGGGGGGHVGGAPHAISVPHAAPSVPHFAPAPHISAPHFSAPRISAPRISIPHAVPHIARVPSISTPRIAPQRFARPVPPAQHPITTGGIPSARTWTGAAEHLQHVTPSNQASRAFALAGAHAAVAGHVLRNPFFANRPAFARATFRGRFAQFPFRHHHHLRPIVIGWFGPLFWPYAYDDFLGYTFYPYAYDTFWPTAYDDVYDGMF